MEWKWFRGKGGIDIVQGEIYRNKMWSVEIINSDEVRVKDKWRLEMLSKIESSKHHLSLKIKSSYQTRKWLAASCSTNISAQN